MSGKSNGENNIVLCKLPLTLTLMGRNFNTLCYE
jgi:hypothetical protein